MLDRFLYFLFFSTVTVSAKQLGTVRFQCGERPVKSPVQLTINVSDFANLTPICPDEDQGLQVIYSAPADAANAQLRVNHTTSGFPGTGTVLYQDANLAVDGSTVDLQAATTDSSRLSEACGTSFITVGLYTGNYQQLLDFNLFAVNVSCGDVPSLRLNVTKLTERAGLYVTSGSVNPLEAIGVEKVEIVNGLQNCSETWIGCDKVTGMNSRFQYDRPDVFVFFLPLDRNIAYEQLRNLGHDMYSMNETEDDLPWMDTVEGFNAEEALWRLTDKYEVVRNGIALHDESLVNSAAWEGGKMPQVAVDELLTKLDISKTRMSATGDLYGYLGVILDPLEKLPDQNRSDNLFLQLIKANQSTNEGREWIQEEPVCSAHPGPAGEVGLIKYMEYDNDQSMLYRTSKRQLYYLHGERANGFRLQALANSMWATNNPNCDNLAVLGQAQGEVSSIFENLEGIVSLFQTQLDGVVMKNAEYTDDLGYLKKVVGVVQQFTQLAKDDEKFRKMMVKMGKMRKGGKGDHGGYGSGHGGGHGGYSGGHGGGYGGYSGGYGGGYGGYSDGYGGGYGGSHGGYSGGYGGGYGDHSSGYGWGHGGYSSGYGDYGSGYGSHGYDSYSGFSPGYDSYGYDSSGGYTESYNQFDDYNSTKPLKDKMAALMDSVDGQDEGSIQVIKAEFDKMLEQGKLKELASLLPFGNNNNDDSDELSGFRKKRQSQLDTLLKEGRLGDLASLIDSPLTAGLGGSSGLLGMRSKRKALLDNILKNGNLEKIVSSVFGDDDDDEDDDEDGDFEEARRKRDLKFDFAGLPKNEHAYEPSVMSEDAVKKLKEAYMKHVMEERREKEEREEGEGGGGPRSGVREMGMDRMGMEGDHKGKDKKHGGSMEGRGGGRKPGGKDGKQNGMDRNYGMAKPNFSPEMLQNLDPQVLENLPPQALAMLQQMAGMGGDMGMGMDMDMSMLMGMGMGMGMGGGKGMGGKGKGKGRWKMDMSKYAAIALEGFLMKGDDMPPEMATIADCFMSILWSDGQPSRKPFCTMLPNELQSNLKEVMEIFLTEKMDGQLLMVLGKLQGNISKQLENLIERSVMPITREKVDKVFNTTEGWIEDMINYTRSKNNSQVGNATNAVKQIFQAMNTDSIKAEVTKMMYRKQDAMVHRKADYAKYGKPGPEPELEEACQSYVPILSALASRKAQKGLPGELLEQRRYSNFMEGMNIWRHNDEGMIQVGEYCSLTNFWFWTNVASCQCGQKMHYYKRK